MRFIAPKFMRRLAPSVIWEIDSRDSVFLTFDDGPTPGVTEWVLHTLERYSAKATFFCLGKNIEQHPYLYDMIIAAGHKVGNHTYSHLRGWSMSLGAYVEDVDFGNQFTHSDLFRPPYGLITPTQARVLSERYNIIMFDILSQDYSPVVSPRQCLNNVIRHLHPGAIVSMHDSRKSARNLSYALPLILEKAGQMGLKCLSIEI